MPDDKWFEKQAQKSLRRLLPSVERALPYPDERQVFINRLRAEFPRLFRLLCQLYGGHYDFFYHFEEILVAAARMYADRSPVLKALDQAREANPVWFQSEQMLGGVCYVDLFAGDLQGLRARLPYFEEMGLTYLHLMPLFRCPAENNDGGYAISDYRKLDPALGSMAELAALAGDLRQRGISLVLDFVFNHTSDEHEWARRALAGDEEYQDYYFMFDGRALPDQYERTLRDIFPEQDPGNFTYRTEVERWVWTTFRRYQWDLNYTNPAVFNAMLQEMLFLANQGVEVLRLDAVVFTWKQMGTGCENLPPVHWIIEAFNALVRVAAPAMCFKSEAIVHPDAVASFIGPEKCPISYNPTMMALLWEALATREVKLLLLSMQKRFAIADDCTWVNYIRCHDDIGWTFADEDAAELWVNAYDHRQFLNTFYTGKFPGSFARGLPFNYNPLNHDMRISGTAASLAGLEQALELSGVQYIDHAVSRILLVHSVVLSAGGIPLLYLGDEIGTLNDYSFRDDPAKAEDSRWVHRPRFDWEAAQRRTDPDTVPGRIFQGLMHLIKLRKQTPALANGHTVFFDTGNVHVLGYVRNGQLLALANFSEGAQTVPREAVAAHWPALGDDVDSVFDLVSGTEQAIGDALMLDAYRFVWLVCRD